MILECKVISVSLGEQYTDGKERVTVRVNERMDLHLPNDDGWKLGERFVLESHPCSPVADPVM